MRKHPHVYSASISTIRLSAIWVFIPLIRTLGLLDLRFNGRTYGRGSETAR